MKGWVEMAVHGYGTIKSCSNFVSNFEKLEPFGKLNSLIYQLSHELTHNPFITPPIHLSIHPSIHKCQHNHSGNPKCEMVRH